jgi:hypothetical protein
MRLLQEDNKYAPCFLGNGGISPGFRTLRAFQIRAPVAYAAEDQPDKRLGQTRLQRVDPGAGAPLPAVRSMELRRRTDTWPCGPEEARSRASAGRDPLSQLENMRIMLPPASSRGGRRNASFAEKVHWGLTGDAGYDLVCTLVDSDGDLVSAVYVSSRAAFDTSGIGNQRRARAGERRFCFPAIMPGLPSLRLKGDGPWVDRSTQ